MYSKAIIDMDTAHWKDARQLPAENNSTLPPTRKTKSWPPEEETGWPDAHCTLQMYSTLKGCKATACRKEFYITAHKDEEILAARRRDGVTRWEWRCNRQCNILEGEEKEISLWTIILIRKRSSKPTACAGIIAHGIKRIGSIGKTFG